MRPNVYNEQMKKLEFFSKAVEAIAELMDIPKQDIISGDKYVAAVDARRLVIYLMHEQRFTSRDIAYLLGITVRCVNISISTFKDRADYSMNDLWDIYDKAGKILGKSEEKAGK